jgi:NlpC/P60 family putative phage cell wall peptidase
MPDIVVSAREWLGTPFIWEASLKGKGCDCRGFLTGVARDCGRPEADTIEANLVGYSRRIDETALLAGLDHVFDRRDEIEPQAGDVLAFRIQRKIQHLGLYAGDGRMIHAYSGNPSQVIEATLGNFWRNRLAGVWAWRDIKHDD